MTNSLLIHYVKTNSSEYFVYQLDNTNNECDLAIMRKTLFGVVKYRILEKELSKLNWEMVGGECYATFLRRSIDALNDYVDGCREYTQSISIEPSMA